MRSLRLALYAAAIGCILTTAVDTQPPSCFVQPGQGPIQGADRGAAYEFLGIPFAVAPVGNLRWRPPQAAAVWSDIFPATTPPPYLSERQCRTARRQRGLPKTERLGQQPAARPPGSGDRLVPHRLLCRGFGQLRIA